MKKICVISRNLCDIITKEINDFRTDNTDNAE